MLAGEVPRKASDETLHTSWACSQRCLACFCGNFREEPLLVLRGEGRKEGKDVNVDLRDEITQGVVYASSGGLSHSWTGVCVAAGQGTVLFLASSLYILDCPPCTFSYNSSPVLSLRLMS